MMKQELEIDPNDISMEDLLKEELTPHSQGGVIHARVIQIGADEVMVDAGFKTEGVVPIQECRRADGSLDVAEGDTIDVCLVSHGKDGRARLSRTQARADSSWRKLEEAMESGAPVEGTVLRQTKGGLIVDVGESAFLPASHADIGYPRNLEQLVGQPVTVKVIELNRRKRNIVVSRRLVLESRRAQQREQVLSTIAAGEIREGVIRTVTAFGAFVDLGGVDGLLHVRDISWARVKKVEDVVTVGQVVRVKVLSVSPEAGRISLGLKQLTPQPWDGVADRYKKGQTVTGTVVSLPAFGAFVEIEPGVEGLIHISEFSWKEKVKQPSDVLSPGQKVEVSILSVDPVKHRISISLRHAQPNPRTEEREHLKRYSDLGAGKATLEDTMEDADDPAVENPATP